MLSKKDQPLSGQGMELNTILKAIKLNVPNFVVQNILNESLKSEKIKKFKYLFFHPYHFSSYIKNMSWWFDIEKKFGLRDKALLLVLYSCGLRASEILGLKLINLKFDHEFLRLIGKGKKERFVPISRLAIKCVDSYINNLRPILSRRNESLGFLFLSS